MKTAEKGVITDFTGKNLTSEMSWKRFKERWNEEAGRLKPDAIVFIGLLHGVMETKREANDEFREVFDFCLEIADGLNGCGDSGTDFGDSRTEIARKAWKVLINKFLANMARGDRDEYDRKKWLAPDCFFNKEPTIRKLIWFFLSPKNNLPKKHPHGFEETLTKNFAVNFCRSVLDSHSELCKRSHPEVVQILHGIGSLDVLEETNNRVLSQDGMLKLREIAFAEVGDPPPKDEFEAFRREGKAIRHYIMLDLRRGLRTQQKWDESVGGRDVPM